MNNIKYKMIFIFLLFAGMFVGCEDLDEDTAGNIAAESFYADEVSLKAGVIGVYRDASEVPHHTGWWILTNGDDVLTTREGSNKQPYRDYDQYMQSGTQEWEYKELWQPAYKAIRSANSYIESVENSRDVIQADETFINKKIGEAKFLRANTFFGITRLWGDVPYFHSTTMKDSATRRTDKRVIYDQIIKDLEYAEQYCVDDKEAPGQASMWSAKAALAKVYMQLTGYPFNEVDKWTKVKQYAGEIISSGKFELMPTYGDLFKYNRFADNKENIFTFTYGLKATGAWQRAYGKPWNAWNDMHCQWKFYNDYPDGARKDFSLQAHMGMAPYKNFIHPCISKFLFGTIKFDPSGINDTEWNEGYEHTWQTSNNIAVDRLADMYLLWAEADANSSGNVSAEAVEYFNMVKRRAKGDINGLGGMFYTSPMEGVDVAAADFGSTDEFIEAIIDERGWEFVGEWGYRWFDLIRLEKLGEVTAGRDNFNLDEAIALSLADWDAKNPGASQTERDAQIAAMKIQASELPLSDGSPTAAKYAFAPLPQVALQNVPGMEEPPLTTFDEE